MRRVCLSSDLGMEIRWSPQALVEMGTCGGGVVSRDGCGMFGGVFVFV